MNRKISLLIVEDSESDMQLIVRQFKKADYDISHKRVETAAQMRSALEKQPWDLVIADYHLPEFDAHSALTILQKSGLDIPFVVVSGIIGEETAVALMKAGAHDCIMKDNLARLIPAVNRELSEAQTRRERQEGEERLKESEGRFRSIFDNIADGILLTSIDGSILTANPAACRMLGRSEEEICQVGRAGVSDLLDSRFVAAIEERKRTGKFKSEHFQLRKDGTRFLCEVSSDTFQDKDGHFRASTIFRDITESKRMAKEIKRAAEEWRTTFDSIEDMIMILDIHYRILRVNRALVSFLGLSYDDILGMHVFDLIHWIKQPPEKCPLARMLNTKTHEELETYIDEKEMWILASVDPIFDNSGSITGGVYIIKNITARKNTEEALRESEERYRIAIENSNDGIAIAREGEHLFVNRKFLEIFGYDQFEDILKTEKHATVHPDDRERVTEINQQRMRGEPTPARYEFKGIRKDGTPVDIEASVAPIIYLGSASTLIYFRDITEQKRAENELRENEKRLQSLMDASPVAMTCSDSDGNVQYINRKFQELFGYSLDEIPTVAAWKKRVFLDQAVLEAYNAQVVKQKEQLNQGKEAISIETALICKDGSTRHVTVMGAVVSNQRMVMYNDITEHKQMEEMLRKSEKQLQAIMDNAPVAVTWSDMEGNFKYMNHAFHELFGYSLDDVPNIRVWKELVHPDPASREVYDAQVVLQVERLKQGLATTPIETKMVCKDGSIRHVKEVGAIASSKRMAIYTDLTERKQMEETLRNSQKELQTIMDAAPVAVSWCDVKTNEIEYLNRKFIELFGYTLEDIPTMDVWHCLAYQNPTEGKEFVSLIPAAVDAYAQGKPAPAIERTVTCKDGSIRFIQIRGVVAANKLVVIFNDLTEQKFAEEALRESENKFRDLVEKSPVGVYLIQDGLFRYVNGRFAEIHGYTVEELVDKKTMLDLAPPEDMPKIFAEIQRKFKGEVESLQYEFRIVTKEGEIKNVAIYVSDTMYRGKPATIGTLLDITEQKRAEEALRESEGKFRGLVEKSFVGVYLIQDGLFRYVNAQFAEIHGYSIEEIVDKMGTLETIVPEDVSKVNDNIQKRLMGEVESSHYEFRIITKQGEIRNVEVYGTRTTYQGKPASIGTLMDITEQKRAEEELRENEQKFQTLLDAAPMAISWSNMAGNIEYCNHKFSELFGYTIEDIPTIAEWRRLAYPDTVYREDDSFPGPYDQGSIWGVKLIAPAEATITCKDGSIRYVVRKGSVVSNRFIAIFDDVTEQKRAEEALRESESKFKDLVEKSFVGVYLTQGNAFQYVNARFAETYGYAIEELVGKKSARDLVLPEDIQKLNDDRQRLASGEAEFFKTEHRIVTKKREIRNVEVYGTYTMYRGKPAVIGTLVDITEQKRADEMLMDLFKDLEKKNAELESTYDELRESQQKVIQQEKMASIGQLAAGIAHEINNPVGFVMSNLHSMGKYSERLSQFIKIQSEAVDRLSKQDGDIAAVLDGLRKKRRALKIDYVMNDYIHVIKESLEGTERVKRIVQDLKNFSHKDEDEHKPDDINEGIESTVNVVWNELKYKANVKKEYGKIPLTKCNLGQLNQVFMNLLINAVQSIEERGEISIKTERKDGDIVVAISDTGSGIPEDKISRIFEPFFTTKEVGKGTGLGLSIAYDIVKKHNGEILVASEIDKGTTFTITIPIVER